MHWEGNCYITWQNDWHLGRQETHSTLKLVYCIVYFDLCGGDSLLVEHTSVAYRRYSRFIIECSKWVKEYCPLDVKNWKQMSKDSKERLLDKIKGEWELPSEAEGIDVDHAISLQCMLLFKGWRYRLKELYFTGKPITEALANTPPGVDPGIWKNLVNYWSHPDQQRISDLNRTNRLSQTIKPANGAKSTARIYHDLLNPPTIQTQEPSQDNGSPSTTEVPTQEPTAEVEEEPAYIILWVKTKRHKDGTWDADAKAKYEEFKKLHAGQIEKNGVDKLSIKEAYIEVLKEKPGYVRGLGPGPLPPKKGRSVDESHEQRGQLTTEVQHLRQQEAALRGEVRELKSSNAEMRAEMDRMKEEAERAKQEALERENKMREEFMQLLASLRR